MTSWGSEAVSEALARYGSIAAGLAIGTAARYGLVLGEGRQLTWRGVVGDILLLGLVGLAAVIISDRLGLTGDMKAFTSALAAVSSDRLIKLLRSRFETIAEAKVDQFARSAFAADLVKVPAGTGRPDTIRIEVTGEDTPLARQGNNLRGAYPAKLRPPDDQIDLLRQLPD